MWLKIELILFLCCSGLQLLEALNFKSAEKYWHMIIGGYKEIPVPTQETLKSVELYNWKTGEQCRLGDFPKPIRGHSGTVWNGEPHICSGTSTLDSGLTQKGCYRLDKNDLQWKSVSINNEFSINAVVFIFCSIMKPFLP